MPQHEKASLTMRVTHDKDSQPKHDWDQANHEAKMVD